MTAEAATHAYEVPLGDIDLSLLPTESQQPGTDEFRKALTTLIEEDFKGFSGWAKILVDDKCVRVSWRQKPEAPDPLDIAIQWLKGGDTRRGVQLLKLILPSRPGDADVHFNLGMALSDQGQFDDAIRHLREALDSSPAFIEARVALGVALGRQHKMSEAHENLAEAVRQAPDNAYALRTYGAVLLQLNRDLSKAEACLRKATQLLPDDQISWMGLAQALQLQRNLKEADATFRKTVDINPASDIAEKARRELSKLAQGSFRAVPGGVLRMDAVEYCLSALLRLDKMPLAEIKKIALEIAALGTKGFDTNNPEKKYDIKSLPGPYSGLQIVSMMYVAFKKVASDADIGFDLAAEYRAALKLHAERGGGNTQDR